ncbi:DExD-box helicase 52 isoform X1 [Tachypleus tridentatus]|uniref:DExD-box helicase 52 isoform X1 n=1 Tax=Tachypleus tridentatus TaxID=6853 RepID=UPI003FD3F866
MDGLTLFRKLGVGAKFDLKRFRSDAQKFKIIRNDNNPSQETVKNVLDFFGGSKEKSESKETENIDLKNTSDDEEEELAFKKQKIEIDEDSLEVNLLGEITSKSKEKAQTEKKRKNFKTPQKLAQLKQEQVNHFRKQNKIFVWGADVPDPVASFDQLHSKYGVHQDILQNIQFLGYSTPTPIQMQAIPLMIERTEILACAPTGSGKTAAFLIPIIHHLKEPKKQGFRAVVVSPTRELAKQTFRECQRLAQGRGLRIHIIDKVNKAAKMFGPSSSQRFDLLVTTPNRLVYLLQQDPPVISLKNVEWLVVDESDKLFEAGKQGFRDQLGVIYKSCDSPNVRHAMFSATFAFEVEEWCKLNLDNVVTISVGVRNTAVDLVEQKLLFVGSESGKLIAFRDMVKKGIVPPVLVFVQTKERAKELFSELIYDGINVDVIHADRSQLQRDNVVKSFRRGKIWILICTELMGRGIDFKGVNLVVNYDFPPSAISYIHRIGRTGRAGRPGQAVTFFTEDDGVNLRSIAQIMKNSGCHVPDYMLKMKKPSKETKRKLVQKAPHRKSITTVPLCDLQKQKKREKIIKRYKQMKKVKISRTQNNELIEVQENDGHKASKNYTKNSRKPSSHRNKLKNSGVK